MNIGNLEVYGIIYKIQNKVNKKVYIGQTTVGFRKRYPYKGKSDIEKVYNYHKIELEKGRRYNSHLKRSIEKYGFENFEVIKIFDIAFSKSELDIKEKIWIKLYDSYNNGYNYCLGGSTSEGYKHDEETRRRMSEVHWDNSGKNNSRAKAIVCLNNRKVYDTITEAEKDTGIYFNSIKDACNGRNSFAGVNQIGLPILWMDYNRYVELSEVEIEKYIKDMLKKSKLKPVICINTMEIFKTAVEASEVYKISKSSIIACCTGYRNAKSAGKHPISGEKMVWAYLSDYKKDDLKSIL